MEKLAKLILMVTWMPMLIWDTSKPLSTLNQCFYGESLYTDPVTRMSYFLACGTGTDDQNYGVQLIKEDKTLGEIKWLGDRITLQDFDPAVKGVGDGKRFFVTESRRRSKNTQCRVGDASGCSEVQIIESNDGGNTWKPPARVGHKNAADTCNRLFDSFIYIIESDWSYIFYTVYNFETSKYAIGWASRGPSDPKFGDEHLIFEGEASFSGDVRAGYTYNKATGLPTIHLFWKGPGGVIRYSNSTNIANWASPISIGRIKEYEKYPMVLYNTRINATALHLVYIYNDFAYIMTTPDEGKTWEAPLQIVEASALVDIHSTFCGAKVSWGMDQRIFMLATGYADRKFILYDLITKKIEVGPQPFMDTGSINSPQLSCFNIPNMFRVHAIGRKASSDGISYLTTNGFVYNAGLNLKPGFGWLISFILLILVLAWNY